MVCANAAAPAAIRLSTITIAMIGVHELILDFRGKSIAHSIARLQRCAPEVIPLVGEQPCH